jgi:hypothetical protein
MRFLHYPIDLPRDHDMAAIVQRVSDKAPAFERLPGLVLKAFLAGFATQGAPRNAYAPLYVWDDAAAMRDFLAGPLFAGVVESFGRPRVLDRQVLEFSVSDRHAWPDVATLEDVVLPAAQPVAAAWQAERDAHRRTLDQAGLYAAAAVLDSERWTVTRVRLWQSSRADIRVPPTAQRLAVLGVVGRATR